MVGISYQIEPKGASEGLVDESDAELIESTSESALQYSFISTLKIPRALSKNIVT